MEGTRMDEGPEEVSICTHISEEVHSPLGEAPCTMPTVPQDFIDRCRYIPIRLTDEERQMLAVLENALNVSEYTDHVDVFSRKSKLERMMDQLAEILTLASGLQLCNNLVKGEQLLARKLRENVPFFQDMFEVGRRYKIMNPDKMRDTYGKLMFMLQDSQGSHMRNKTGFTLVKDILMVYSFLQERHALDLLRDPLILTATASIEDDPVNKTRQQISAESVSKKQAQDQLRTRYTSAALTADEVQRVLDSISDNYAYISFNVKPVERMLTLLTDNFQPQRHEDPFSLELQVTQRRYTSFTNFYGSSSSYMGGGAKLNHDHRTQFTFVFQSLSLWREIMMHMPKLWYMADQDLLSDRAAYHLSNTGQGLNRMQSCPNVGAEMRRILAYTHTKVGPWVGLSVVHLGDHDVPNALVFIDKYTQVPRILAPIAACLEKLESMDTLPAIHAYIKSEWATVRQLRLQVLSDFFKHGFDGSGDDGGSCIDGRLTSAWNWCSKLANKPYYHVFMLSGFQGFDGDFKD